MTKTELIKKWQESESVHHDTAYSVSQLERLLSSLCGVMASELFEGGEVSLPPLRQTHGGPLQGPRRPQPEDRGKAPYSRSAAGDVQALEGV